MDRFFLAPDQWEGNLALTGAEAHHCGRVMRKQAGDRVLIFDGRGREGQAEISELSKNEVGLVLLEERVVKGLSPQIEIAVGVPKGKTFELILQKAVEMGVTRIQPLISEQGNVRFKGNEGEAKREKWQRVALEACKQCGQNVLPEVALPRDVGSYLAALEGGEARFVGALREESRAFKALLDQIDFPERVSIMVGPEGDFSSNEYERIMDAGFAPVDLGDLVLRSETAVFWMLAALRYHFQG